MPAADAVPRSVVERGVEVGLVEDLDAAVKVAIEREKVDHPPLGVEALLARSPSPRGWATAPRLSSRCTASMKLLNRSDATSHAASKRTPSIPITGSGAIDVRLGSVVDVNRIREPSFEEVHAG